MAGLNKPKLRVVDRVGWAFTFAAAYDLVRLPKLLAVRRHEQRDWQADAPLLVEAPRRLG